MGLMATAAADLLEIIQDDGEDITITSPTGGTEDFKALTQDIYLAIDPGTGMIASGRQATVAINISSLKTAGFDDIKGIAKGKPWLVFWTDVNGSMHTFKVVESHPDRSIGLQLCRLEAYRELS